MSGRAAFTIVLLIPTVTAYAGLAAPARAAAPDRPTTTTQIVATGAPPAVDTHVETHAAAQGASATRAAAPLPGDEPALDAGTAERLRTAVDFYRGVVGRGGWPTLPADAQFAPGQPTPYDKQLRERLAMTGDLPQAGSGPFDAGVEAAVRRFQIRHGLTPTGRLGPQTRKALNVPAAPRLQQLEASRARLGLLGFGFGPRYVVVNIPAAVAEAIADGKVVRRYRVIVGKTDKPSPTLVASITSVKLNPNWTVPASIVRNEISQKMSRDRDYLDRLHMRVFDRNNKPLDPTTIDWSSESISSLTVRQEPGSWNALGSVKIEMPNAQAVYMHDTDRRNLFEKDYRFDSHGCARVDDVRELAAWLLDDQPRWSRASIDAGIAEGRQQEIRLTKKVPVAWVYLTAWMDGNQTVQFRDDVYDQDAQLLAAIKEDDGFFSEASAK